MAELGYRRCIVCVFRDASGKVLVGKRKNIESWQFPQGGIEAGEQKEEALFREMKEELGVNQFDIVKQLEDPITYDFPLELKAAIARKFKGQEQYWFLCKLLKDDQPDLDIAQDDEFSELAWITPMEAIDRVIWWKKKSYLKALRLFGVLTPMQSKKDSVNLNSTALSHNPGT